MNPKFKKNIYHADVKVSWMKENIIQIKSRITINIDAILKDIIYMKEIIFGILLHPVVKMIKFWKHY